MLNAYFLDTRKLNLNIGGGNPSASLSLSANPYKKDGLPYGLVAINGFIHNAMPDELPLLLVYTDGGSEIRKSCTAKHLADARFAFSGSALLMEDGEMLDVTSPLSIDADQTLHRIGLGLDHRGKLICVEQQCTVTELQLILYYLGAVDAMMTAFGDVYLDYKLGGVEMGTKKPVTVLEAVNVKELPQPVVVIDAGHGGTDPGASAFGLVEKNLVLTQARVIHKHLSENFEGTFLMMRDDDSTISPNERARRANAIGADFYLSLHTNADASGRGTGYESFVFTTPSKASTDIQSVMHPIIADFFKSFGFPDRGRKRANFGVLRETKCPAVLVENLFISTISNNAKLKDPDFVQGIGLITAKAVAKALELEPKVSVEIPDVDKTLYRVQVGAFRFKKGAEDMLERLRVAGFSGIIRKD